MLASWTAREPGRSCAPRSATATYASASARAPSRSRTPAKLTASSGSEVARPAGERVQQGAHGGQATVEDQRDAALGQEARGVPPVACRLRVADRRHHVAVLLEPGG